MKPPCWSPQVWLPVVLAAAIASSHAWPPPQSAAPPRPRAITLPQLRGQPPLGKPTTFELVPSKSSLWHTHAGQPTEALTAIDGELLVDDTAGSCELTVHYRTPSDEAPRTLRRSGLHLRPGPLPGLWRMDVLADSAGAADTGWLVRLPGSPIRLTLITPAGSHANDGAFGLELAWKRVSR